MQLGLGIRLENHSEFKKCQLIVKIKCGTSKSAALSYCSEAVLNPKELQ